MTVTLDAHYDSRLYLLSTTHIWASKLKQRANMTKRNSKKSKKLPAPKTILDEQKSKDCIVSLQNVNKIALKMCRGKAVTVTDYSVETYGIGSVLGILGSHYSLMIKVLNESQEKNTLYAFVKTVPFDDELRSKYVKKMRLLEKERSFYESISPFLYAYSQSERWSPQLLSSGSEALVLEDLFAQGYQMYANWLNDAAMMKAALSTLASFHGGSILAEAFYARQKKATTLYEEFKDALSDRPFLDSHTNRNWILTSITLACELYRAFTNGAFPADMHRVMTNEYLDPSARSPGHAKVICHGDLWWNNMMFNCSGPRPKCMLVDFQMIKYGFQVHDVLQLMYLHSTRDWRQKHELEMLLHYHNEIERIVGKSSLAEYAAVSSYSDLEYSYNDRKIYGLVVACLYLPFTLMDEAFLDECVKNLDQAEEFTWAKRLEITKNYLNKNDEALSRIKEVILETSDHCDLIINYEMYLSLTVMDKFNEPET